MADKYVAPSTIYLQLAHHFFDTTWCDERIDEEDVAYIRRDLVKEMFARLDDATMNGAELQ